MKLLIHSKTSTATPLKFGKGWVISSYNLLDRWLHIHARIKANQVSKRGRSLLSLTTLITNIPRSTSTEHQSNIFESGPFLIDVDPMVFDIWKYIHYIL